MEFKKITVVVPIFNEAYTIPILYDKLTRVMLKCDKCYELLFIDDGSTDLSGDALRLLDESDEHVKVIHFRRNFGKSAALSAGFAQATGDIVFTMDGDLQDDPDEIPRFLAKIHEGYDLVSGWKYPRMDPLSKTLPSKVFNLVLRLATGLKLHDFNCGFKAYRRAVTEEIRLYGELHRYTPILAFQKGFRVGEINIRHHSRKYGRSKYGVGRFARGFFDLLTVMFLGSYGWRPLHLFGWAGLFSFGLGLITNLYLTVLWFQGHGPIGGRPLLVLGVLLIILGIQFFSIGLLGEMLTNGQANKQKSYSVKDRLE